MLERVPGKKAARQLGANTPATGKLTAKLKLRID